MVEIVAIPPSARLTRLEVEVQSEMSDVLGLRRLAEEEITVAAESLAVLGDPVWVRRGPATFRDPAGRRTPTDGEGHVIASDATGPPWRAARRWPTRLRGATGADEASLHSGLAE